MITKQLVSLPTGKWASERLTVGKFYEVIKYLGNGVVIATDDMEETVWILKERME